MSIFPQLLANGLIAGALYTLVVLGFNLQYSTAKFFNLAHGVMAAVGGYTVFYLLRQFDLPAFGAILAGVVFAGLVGWLLEVAVYRPLRRRGATHLVLLIASLGAFTVLQALLAILFSSQFRTLRQTNVVSETYTLAGAVITEVQLTMLVCGLVIMAGLMLLLRFTKFGKAIKATADDEEVAKIVGINTSRVIGLVFFISSAIAGLAGILIGYDTGIEPTMGLPLLLKGVIAAIIGGVGNTAGGVLGAFILGLVENFGIWKISGQWKDVISFGLLIIFLIFRPRGLFRK